MIDNYDFWSMECEHYWSGTKKDDVRALAKNFIFSGDYIGSRKVDGHWYSFGKDLSDEKQYWLRSRTKGVNGDFANKLDWVPHLKEDLIRLPDGTVLIGEVFFPKNEGSKNVTTIMGCLKEKAIARQEKGEKLHYYIFDVLAWNGESMMKTPFEKRVEFLNTIVADLFKEHPYIHTATYYEGEELWNYVMWALNKGYEGVVIQRKDSVYTPNKRTARKTLKIKKEIKYEIDAFLTGRIKPATREYTGKEPEKWLYWENVRTKELLYGEENYDAFFENGIVVPVTKDYYLGLPSSVEFGVKDKDGNDVPVCWISNLTDNFKQEVKDSPTSLRGRVSVLTAMEIDDKTYSLRHSKIVSWRADGDKSMEDCSIDQLFR